MTWVKIDDNAPDDPRALSLSRGVRLLHFEALAWASRHLTAGAIPRGVLGRLTDEPDAESAVLALVGLGLWNTTEEGWQLVWLQDDQPPPELVARWRERNRKKQDRHRRHISGDHSACRPPYCKSAGNPVTNRASNPYPSRPVRPVSQDRDGRGGNAADLGVAAVAPSTNETPSLGRRELARIVREATGEAMRHRYRKNFDRVYGHLYEASAQ
jgi:hypothetical protein